MRTKHDFGILFWVHLILTLAYLSSPFWFNWKVVIYISIFFFFYHLFRKGCDLTYIELGHSRHMTFVWYYLRKMFPTLNKNLTWFIGLFLSPLILIALALLIKHP